MIFLALDNGNSISKKEKKKNIPKTETVAIISIQGS